MAINVSTFELLVKPIAPRSPIPLPFQGVARRVVQGYFLTITNPIDSFSEENQVNQLSSLVANLGQVEPSAENLTQLSDLLGQMNIPIVMQPRQ